MVRLWPHETKHILSALQFNRESLGMMFRGTQTIKTLYNGADEPSFLRYCLLKESGAQFRACLLFCGESTRTRSSFEEAFEQLGGVAKFKRLEFSSAAKGEGHKSTAIIEAQYGFDCLIVRDDKHRDAARVMAQALETHEIPTIVINAGGGEHPTQMLLDLYTIWERLPDALNNGKLTIAFIGDIAHSRTIHSLLMALTEFGGVAHLVGPEAAKLPPMVTERLRDSALTVIKTARIRDIVADADVFYFTRLQDNLRKRKPSDAERKKYASQFCANPYMRKHMKPDSLALHPLPHGPEYPSELDDKVDPRFIHFEQAKNGLYVRQWLLKEIFAPTFDLRANAAPEETVVVSGAVSAFPVRIRDITGSCAAPDCASIRLRGSDWVRMDPHIKSHLRKPLILCPYCRPDPVTVQREYP
ncbi:MAG: hypothetical protein AAB539_01800 [Patescibacteria group bacterium]